jgi:hypothetical protein
MPEISDTTPEEKPIENNDWKKEFIEARAGKISERAKKFLTLWNEFIPERGLFFHILYLIGCHLYL